MATKKSKRQSEFSKSLARQAQEAKARAEADKHLEEIEKGHQVFRKKTTVFEEIISGASSLISGNFTLPSFINSIKSDFSWFSLVASILTLPINVFKIIHEALLNKKKTSLDKAKRGMRIAMAIGSIALEVTSIIVTIGIVYVAWPILLLTSVAKSLFENTWSLGTSLYKRFVGQGRQDQKQINEWKNSIIDANLANKNVTEKTLVTNNVSINSLTDKINKQRTRHKRIARKAHSILQACGALVGAALLFTPAAPAGVIILGAVAAYGILNTVKLNPFALLGRGINALSKKITGKPVFDPFSEKTVDEVRMDLVKEIQHQQSQKPQGLVSENVAQAAAQATLGDGEAHNTAQVLTRIAESNGNTPVILATDQAAVHGDTHESHVEKEQSMRSPQTGDTIRVEPVKKEEESEGEGEGVKPTVAK